MKACDISSQSRFRSRAGTRRRLMALGAGALVLVAAGQANAMPKSSLRSGRWTDPAMWTPQGVPAAGDTVTINAGHTVHVNEFGAFPGTTPYVIDVASLAIQNNATLVSDSFLANGNTLEIRLDTLNLEAGGRIRGQDGGTIAAGDSVYISNRAGGPQFFVLCQGVISGGDGVNGGNAQVRQTAFNLGGSMTIAAPTAGAGQVRGGNNTNPFQGQGGFAHVESRDLAVALAGSHDAIVRGGDTLNPCRRGGNVVVYAYNFLDINGIDPSSGANVKGGDNIAANPDRRAGGNVLVRGLNIGRTQSGSRIESGMPFLVNPTAPSPCGTGSIERSCITRFGRRDSSFGAMVSDCVSWDPPDLILEGNGTIDACVVEIGAATFTARNLNPANAPAIDAAETLTFRINPGGVLDLSQLTPGTEWFRAPGGITIYADPASILLPVGTTLANFMNPAPTVLPGEVMRAICLTPESGHIPVQAGQSTSVPITVANCGAANETFVITASDQRGWVTPFSHTVTLAPGDSLEQALGVNVPTGIIGGANTVLSVNVRTASTPIVEQNALVVIGLPGVACDADFDGSGDVTSADFFAFIVAFLNGDQTADYNTDTEVNTADFFAFLQAFFTPC